LDSAAAISPSFLVISESRSLADIPFIFSICFRFEYANLNQFVLPKTSNKTTKRNNSYVNNITHLSLLGGIAEVNVGQGAEGLEAGRSMLFQAAQFGCNSLCKERIEQLQEG